MAIVGFFDILGTREAVLHDRFSDLTALDFAGPAGIAAELIPSMRFAVFSDSVIASAESGDERSFLKAVALMYGQWFADFVLVRGGIAVGEIRWVDYEAVDKHFRKCKNLACARVYGKGLVLAHELEQRSGPGAISYLTEQAAAALSAIEPNAVLPGISPALCWASEREATTLLGYSTVNLEHEPDESAARRHAIATQSYWQQVITQRKYLPDLYQLIPCA
jgi:hypothetical protein